MNGRTRTLSRPSVAVAVCLRVRAKVALCGSLVAHAPTRAACIPRVRPINRSAPAAARLAHLGRLTEAARAVWKAALAEAQLIQACSRPSSRRREPSSFWKVACSTKKGL